MNNNGTHEIKINGVKPLSGHANTSNKPERTLNSREEDFFKKIKIVIGRQDRIKRSKNRIIEG